jgi:deoxyadenosine/deoxycytidine kinase
MNQERDRETILIAVVGPCASGKTTLVEALNAHGYNARQVAQEHSYVPSMWEKITQPDVLVYLDASYETCTKRKSLDWNPKEYQAQVERLAYARKRCDLYVDTEDLTPEGIQAIALEFLKTAVD